MSQVKTLSYEVKAHSGHKRLRHIELDNAALKDFFDRTQDINVERMEYVPFERFHLAQVLRENLGTPFQNEIRGILLDRASGGFTVGVQGQTTEIGDYIKLATAITHLIGIPNYDSMSGKYYARFTVKHTDESDTYLRQAYRNLELHTDGTFVNEETDWLLMMKFMEENAIGGESRFLHLDDWDERESFQQHPLATHDFKFSYADRGSKQVKDVVNNPTFYRQNNTTCMRYNHQCTHPRNIEQALYLKQLQESIENTVGTISVPLPVGQLVMLNNHFWLHGREAFEPREGLFRELMRQRGTFARI